VWPKMLEMWELIFSYYYFNVNVLCYYLFKFVF
jgi:hypothetical protein